MMSIVPHIRKGNNITFNKDSVLFHSSSPNCMHNSTRHHPLPRNSGHSPHLESFWRPRNSHQPSQTWQLAVFRWQEAESLKHDGQVEEEFHPGQGFAKANSSAWWETKNKKKDKGGINQTWKQCSAPDNHCLRLLSISGTCLTPGCVRGVLLVRTGISWDGGGKGA